MRDRAVVALEKVLAGDLPVRSQLVLGAMVEAERGDVGQQLREAPESLGEWRRAGIGVHEYERAPGVDRERKEREAGCVEAGLPVGPRRRPEFPIQSIRPGVIRALQRRTASVAFRHD